MKNLAFHGLLRWKIIILILTTSLIHFYLKVGRMYFFYLGSERINRLMTHRREAHRATPHWKSQMKHSTSFIPSAGNEDQRRAKCARYNRGENATEGADWQSVCWSYWGWVHRIFQWHQTGWSCYAFGTKRNSISIVVFTAVCTSWCVCCLFTADESSAQYSDPQPSVTTKRETQKLQAKNEGTMFALSVFGMPTVLLINAFLFVEVSVKSWSNSLTKGFLGFAQLNPVVVSHI